MKSYPLCILVCLLLVAACANDDMAPVASSTATIQCNAQLSRAATRAYGEGDEVATLSYAIYQGEELTLVDQGDHTIPFTNGTAALSAKVRKGNSYTILFWADGDNGVYTFGAQTASVTMDYNALTANDEACDAFFGVIETGVLDDDFSCSLELTRALAQLNFGTNDKDADALSTTSYSITIPAGLPTTLSLLTGETSTPTTANLTLTATGVYNAQTYPVEGDYLWVSSIYLLAGYEELTLTEPILFATQDVTTEVQEVTLRRNYRTNIQGALFTASSDDTQVTIEVDDKSYKQLYAHTLGDGIPVVLMGDGFTEAEIADGTYDTVMAQAMENLFTEEPITSLKAYFDVYMIYAVSEENQFGDDHSTAFSCSFDASSSTVITGDYNTVFSYVRCISNIDWVNTLAVVILNSNDYAGTTYFGFKMSGSFIKFAVAYCPVINGLTDELFRTVLVHEAIGHGFAWLADDFAYQSYGRISSSDATTLKTQQSTYGFFMNVDTTSSTSSVLWADFLSDDNYSNESIPLGVYEGGYTYWRGVYRPSDDSMMNTNVLGFNAPCRQQLYKQVMERGTGVTPTYDEFTAYDADHKPANVTRTCVTAPAAAMPLPAPQVLWKELKY